MLLAQQLKDAEKLIKLGKNNEAISAYEAIIDNHGECSEATSGLALGYARNNDYLSGFPYIERTVKQNPASGEIWYFYAKYLVGMMRYEDALKIFDIAIIKQHSPVELYLDKIETLIRLNRFDAALELSDKLLAAIPSNVEALNRKAGILNSLGRNSEAAEVYLKILELKPDDAFSIFNLSHMRLLPEDYADKCDPENAVYQSASHSAYSRSALYFSQAFEAEREKNYNGAFEFYSKANELIHDKHPFNRDAFAQRIDNLISIFGRNMFEKYEGFGDPSSEPVFILGMPRSGTTLIEQIISSHPDVCATGENGVMLKIEKELIHNAKVQNVPYPDIVTRLAPANMKKPGNSYMKNIASFFEGAAKHFTDKTPLNFLHVGLINLILPNAKIIHTKRNALDTCLSCYFTNFSDGVDLGFSFNLEDTGFYYNQYLRLMTHWESVLPGKMLHIEYETLLDNQEGTTKRILDHIGLPWDERCLRFQDNQRAVNTASKDQVRNGLYKTSVERWRNYEGFIGGLKEELGNKIE